jgi:hypothetical protein
VISLSTVKLPLSPSVFTSLTDNANSGMPSTGFSVAAKTSRMPAMFSAHTTGSNSPASTSRPEEFRPRW